VLSACLERTSIPVRKVGLLDLIRVEPVHDPLDTTRVARLSRYLGHDDDVRPLERSDDEWTVRRHDELQVRQLSRERGQNDHLPFRVQVEIDFVDHDDSPVFGQLLAGRTGSGNVIQQIGDPSDQGAIAIRQRREGNGKPLTLKEILAIRDLVSKREVVRTEETIEELDDLLYLVGSR
jgi:hypothetical protein